MKILQKSFFFFGGGATFFDSHCRSLIRSVIDYGSVAYNSASDSAKHMLNVIQHKGLRLASGAFCSTAAAALQVETGELPLHLRRSQHEIKYSVQVKANKGHPAKIPQGSVLGPQKFSQYTEDIADLITNHRLSYHLYADDTQLLRSTPTSTI